MKLTPSHQRSFISGRELANRAKAGRRAIDITTDQAVSNYRALEDVGVYIEPNFLKSASNAWAMDDAQGLTLTPTATGVPVQFLQQIMPGIVETVFGVTVADMLIGISTIGNWEDEQVVQIVSEGAGQAKLYRDYHNAPLANSQFHFNWRSIVQGEAGMQVGLLEESRSSAMRVNIADAKRRASTIALEQFRNRIAFLGFNSGANRTYGILNDPSLPAYVNVPNGAGASTLWANKTFKEIINDIQRGFNALSVSSKGYIDPIRADITLAIPTGFDVYLTRPSDIGNTTVFDWLLKNYPRTRVVSAPQFALANGAANVYYMWADTVDDGSTDDNRTWVQPVPVKFRTVGTQKMVSSYVELYSNATAGAMLKRAYAVYRGSGI